MKLPLENIQAVAQQVEAAMIDFAQHMIRTPSLPGQENEVAAIISNEMNELAYDEVSTGRLLSIWIANCRSPVR